jgi:hypothetical protein
MPAKKQSPQDVTIAHDRRRVDEMNKNSERPLNLMGHHKKNKKKTKRPENPEHKEPPENPQHKKRKKRKKNKQPKKTANDKLFATSTYEASSPTDILTDHIFTQLKLMI